MKKLAYLIALLLIETTAINAQFKDYPKIAGMYSEGKYQVCIDNASKILEKLPNEFFPVIYCSKCYLAIYKTADEKNKLSNLKNSLKYAARINKIDKKKEYSTEYSDFLVELHEETLKYAAGLYDGEQKDKSKPLFEYLVKVYNDTTEQYYNFYPDQRKKQIAEVGINTPNQKVNQVDSKGLKQGFWTKVYKNGNKAYEVYFKDNIPVGEYKRYNEDGKLSAFLVYDDKGEWADAKLYDENEKLIGEGKYHGKLKHGHWTYYQNNIKILEDNYNEGKRDGIAKAYFDNGNVSDVRNFSNDIENGAWKQYYPSGKIRLETRIDSGIRNSVYYVYYENGKLQIRGKYKKDHMDGEWIYYDTDGKEKEKINYVMGKTEKQVELDKDENKFFEEIEKNRNRFLDPADFIHNPNDYLKNNGLRQD